MVRLLNIPGGNYVIVQIGAVFNLWYPFLSGLLMLLFSNPKISWMRKAFFLFLLESAKFRDKMPLQNWESIFVRVHLEIRMKFS